MRSRRWIAVVALLGVLLHAGALVRHHATMLGATLDHQALLADLGRICHSAGTPTIPGPRSVSTVRAPTELMPFAGRSPPLERREIIVPAASGLNVFLIRIGMRFATAGAIVAECSTFAPKYDSSIASS